MLAELIKKKQPIVRTGIIAALTADGRVEVDFGDGIM